MAGGCVPSGRRAHDPQRPRRIQHLPCLLRPGTAISCLLSSLFLLLLLTPLLVDSYQSGTGKTYTMWGPLAAMFDNRSDRADRGIVPRFFQNLFSQIQGVRALSLSLVPGNFQLGFDFLMNYSFLVQNEEASPEKHTSYQCRCSFLEVLT